MSHYLKKTKVHLYNHFQLLLILKKSLTTTLQLLPAWSNHTDMSTLDCAAGVHYLLFRLPVKHYADTGKPRHIYMNCHHPIHAKGAVQWNDTVTLTKNSYMIDLHLIPCKGQLEAASSNSDHCLICLKCCMNLTSLTTPSKKHKNLTSSTTSSTNHDLLWYVSPWIIAISFLSWLTQYQTNTVEVLGLHSHLPKEPSAYINVDDESNGTIDDSNSKL